MDKAGANVGGEHGGLANAILDAENLRREAGRNILFVHGMNVGWFGCGPHLSQRELAWSTRKVIAKGGSTRSIAVENAMLGSKCSGRNMACRRSPVAYLSAREKRRSCATQPQHCAYYVLL
jgi:hypothetical protein